MTVRGAIPCRLSESSIVKEVSEKTGQVQAARSSRNTAADVENRLRKFFKPWLVGERNTENVLIGNPLYFIS